MTDLRPILEAQPSVLRVRGALGPPQTHFGQRAEERGIVSIPGDALRLAVEWAARNGRGDFLDPVFMLPGASCERVQVFRFLAPEGVFFALVSPDGTPITVYDRTLMRRVRRVRRRRRKGGRRHTCPTV